MWPHAIELFCDGDDCCLDSLSLLGGEDCCLDSLLLLGDDCCLDSSSLLGLLIHPLIRSIEPRSSRS